MNEPKRIAIYGGTFDPVHSGHLEIGKRVCRLFEIDEFLYLPARVAPHKVGQESASAFDRYAMLALATQNEPRLSISRFELDGPGRQYTVDTLQHFRQLYGEAVDLFFVMGADSWTELTTWREWQRLPALAKIVVVTRPGRDVSSGGALELATLVEDVRGHKSVNLGDDRPRIYLTDAVELDVSSTLVRQATCADDEKLKQLVPAPVAEYIRKYRLYRKTNEAKFKC
ncbi:MAG TPA: nicotinate-nucleotide adenylyltransferase [Pyrinomonadaceae bacterium]|nr:nicotinate-nucleotide adenylyltransferase [Pyrinomonadaceae bacterium]